MMKRIFAARIAQRGIVMISSLLLLVVVTIIALSMFRSFGIQERIAGNMREKQRALQAAMSAQQYAEFWLSNGGGAASTPVSCSGPVLNANLNQGQICGNGTQLPTVVVDVTSVPWQINSTDVGVTYTPPGMRVTGATSVSSLNAQDPTYIKSPLFYISDMGPSADASIPGEIYQVDAVGYGGNSSTVAVVESTYAVYVSSSNRTL